jgi:hypothetical protein
MLETTKDRICQEKQQQLGEFFAPPKHVKKNLNFVHTGDENFQLQ